MPLQDAKRYCREVVRIIKLLKQSRDMTINEVKLTLAIEDPTQRERREYLGVEVRACSSRRGHAAWLLPVFGSQPLAAGYRYLAIQARCVLPKVSVGITAPQHLGGGAGKAAQKLGAHGRLPL